VIGLDWESQ